VKVLVLFAHPVENSLAASLHKAVVEGLTEAGHAVDDCDLYAEGFQPVLSREERLGYHDVSCNRAPVDSYVERLMSADAFVMVHPVWNFGLPAILKGFFDRVFLPGVSFRLEGGGVVPNLTNIRKAMVVKTYGATRWRAFVVGDPPHKIAKRFLWGVFRTPGPVKVLSLYDMNNVTEEKCAAFVNRVRQAARNL